MGLGLYDALITRIETASLSPREVYCQNCYTPLTTTGAMVSDTGKVYCRSNKRPEEKIGTQKPCYETAGFEIRKVRFQAPDQVQANIRSGDITGYQTLEDRAA